VTLKAELGICLTHTAHASSLRIQGPRSVSGTKSKREDRNYNREQHKHLSLPGASGQSFGASRPKFGGRIKMNNYG
jgi:hypothetical protein